MTSDVTGTRTRSYGNPYNPTVHTLSRTHTWGSGTCGTCTASDQPTDTHYPLSYDDDYDYTVMTDVVTPNFRRRIKAGELILNPMSKVRTITSIPGGSSSRITWWQDHCLNECYFNTFRHYGEGNISFYYLGAGYGPELPLLEPMVDSDAQLLTAAVSRVDPTSYHVMEDVLQLRQFSESVLHPIEGMRSVVKKMNSHRQSTRNLGAAAAWAKYRFEFLPLLGTAEALIRTALDHSYGLKKDIRMRSTATTGGSDRKAGIYTDSKTGTFSWNIDLTEVVRKRAVVFYKLRTDHVGLSQSLGTRFKDLPTGLWNVVPYSFIVDRVINISQYLTALSNLCDPTVSLEGACITTKRYNRSSMQVTGREIPADRGYAYEGKPMLNVVDSTTRVIVNPYMAADLLAQDFRPIDLVKNVTRAIDLLALIVLGLKGGKRS